MFNVITDEARKIQVPTVSHEELEIKTFAANVLGTCLTSSPAKPVACTSKQ